MRRLTTLTFLSPLTSRRPELHPARALLTPTWLLALVVLALNDHMLKGAGLLPGVVTGKLSDFAGMVVAPVLLAALLRVRSRRGLLHCHAAVAAVFAGINLSPAVADAWSALMGLVWPWHITVDPTDLVALPALALGWRALVPAMTRPLPALPAYAPRAAEGCAVAVGAFLCVATSEHEPPQDDWGADTDTDTDADYVDLQADVYLHNASDHDLRVRTRSLRPDVLLDCIAVDEDPGLLLSESLFGEGQTVLLPPTTNVGVRDLTEVRECYAVRVEGDSFAAPILLYWRGADIQSSLIDGDIDDPALHSAGAVLLADDGAAHTIVQEARSPIVFAVDTAVPAGAFQPGPDGERLGWSDPPYGEHLLTAVDVGPDGCVAATIDDQDQRWYVCAPDGAFPFTAGQWVRVADRFGALEVERIPDPQDVLPVPLARLTLSRGDLLPSVTDLVLAAKPDYTAVIAPEEVCGTVARPDEVTARFEAGEVVHLLPGDDVTVVGETGTLTLWVAHAEDRVVLDAACAEGPDVLGADLEIAALVVADEP